MSSKVFTSQADSPPSGAGAVISARTGIEPPASASGWCQYKQKQNRKDYSLRGSILMGLAYRLASASTSNPG
ncbi:hypothetical protein PABG_01578 [Paracoccidioides brasiliensis Pb03]|nr:hypothetical protein PABG_01578 [Paracoccidioides brasiliensis Pb03]